MTDWIFHIGYQKCASTWLQLKVFPRLSDVNYLGKRSKVNHTAETGGVHQPVFAEFYHQLTLHPFDFEKRELASSVAHYEANDTNQRVALISSEGLVGTPWRGAIDGPERLKRISEHFENAKILVVIRNQIDILESFYKQYLLSGGTGTVDVLYGPPTLHVDFRLGFLDYHKMAGFCADLFGRDRICVLPYELIRVEGHQAFCDRICDFFGLARIKLREEDIASVRKGYDLNVAHYARFANYFLKSFFNPCGPFRVSSFPGRTVWFLARTAAAVERTIGRRRRIFDSERLEELCERYRAGNGELSTFCKVDVSKLGYPV